MVSRCFPGGYNVKLYISRGRLAWWLLAFLHSVHSCMKLLRYIDHMFKFEAGFKIPDGQVVRTGISGWDMKCTVMIWSSWVKIPVRLNLGCVAHLSKSYTNKKEFQNCIAC